MESDYLRRHWPLDRQIFTTSFQSVACVDTTRALHSAVLESEVIRALLYHNRSIRLCNRSKTPRPHDLCHVSHHGI